MITRKSRAEIEKMRRAGRVVAEVLALAVPHPEGVPLLYVDGGYRTLD